MAFVVVGNVDLLIGDNFPLLKQSIMKWKPFP